MLQNIGRTYMIREGRRLKMDKKYKSRSLNSLAEERNIFVSLGKDLYIVVFNYAE